MAAMKPLAGVKIVTTAFNLPGPAALSKLDHYGASIVKVEPPGGDPLGRHCPELYRELLGRQQVVELNLKDERDRRQLDEHLRAADVLVTSTLPSSLERLDLNWTRLHSAFPRLCQVAIVGYPPPDEELTGHDLTYQASVGLVCPPALPLTLLGDMAGAQSAVTETFAVLAERARIGEGVFSMVPIASALDFYTLPLRHGMTVPGGHLGGALPYYNLYPTRAGWLAVAALEPQFWVKLQAALELKNGTYAELKAVFAERTAAEWQRWAEEQRLPIAEVLQSGKQPND
jgi:crotonobetainyl-CoA:carnitine CoA-transferase CaiB-like acyl-CoA transferase